MRTTTVSPRTTVSESSHYGNDVTDRVDASNIVPNRQPTTTPSHTEPEMDVHQPIPPSPSHRNTSDETATYATPPNGREFGIEISKGVEEKQEAKQMGYRTKTLSSVYDLPFGEAMDTLPLPSPASVFYAFNRRPRSSRENADNITLDVESKRVIFYTSK
ncbi:hypothetical protein COOONC_19429 [Cooperia oncophora]